MYIPHVICMYVHVCLWVGCQRRTGVLSALRVETQGRQPPLHLPPQTSSTGAQPLALPTGHYQSGECMYILHSLHTRCTVCTACTVCTIYMYCMCTVCTVCTVCTACVLYVLYVLISKIVNHTFAKITN